MNGCREARSHAGWLAALLFLLVGLALAGAVVVKFGSKLSPLWSEEKQP